MNEIYIKDKQNSSNYWENWYSMGKELGEMICANPTKMLEIGKRQTMINSVYKLNITLY